MVNFHLRIPEDLHARLTAQAAVDRRSLNAEILHLLEGALPTPVADAESAGGDPAA
jgi:predicted HicB family RNase H-like nuclease